jgi:hypothetical protein
VTAHTGCANSIALSAGGFGSHTADTNHRAVELALRARQDTRPAAPMRWTPRLLAARIGSPMPTEAPSLGGWCVLPASTRAPAQASGQRLTCMYYGPWPRQQLSLAGHIRIWPEWVRAIAVMHVCRPMPLGGHGPPAWGGGGGGTEEAGGAGQLARESAALREQARELATAGAEVLVCGPVGSLEHGAQVGTINSRAPAAAYQYCMALEHCVHPLRRKRRGGRRPLRPPRICRRVARVLLPHATNKHLPVGAGGGDGDGAAAVAGCVGGAARLFVVVECAVPPGRGLHAGGVGEPADADSGCGAAFFGFCSCSGFQACHTALLLRRCSVAQLVIRLAHSAGRGALLL